MNFKVVIGETANTKCHKCNKVLKGEKYLRIEGLGKGQYGNQVHMSLCKSCLIKIQAKIAKDFKKCC